jgi:4-amino-4-deoxy-L-arabinose transferase-like glycosyltransferase
MTIHSSRRVLARIGRSRDARTAVACAAVAFVSLFAWAIVTPPFQGPDEPTHLAYAQRLAETGRPPDPDEIKRPPLSSEGRAGLVATNFSGVIGNPFGKPPWTAKQQRAADRLLHSGAPQDDGGGAAAYSSYPPLYYLVAAGPYLVADAAGATIIGKLTAVRLLSCVLSALTVLLVFLFVRELVPGSPRAWLVGALSVALLPYFGFVGSSANNDVLVTTLSAALLFVLARAFRRGLTPAGAASAGLLIALGILTKPVFYGLLPGAAVALLVLLVRAWRDNSGAPRRALGALVVAVGVPLIVYAAINTGVWGRPIVQDAAVLEGTQASTAPQRSIRGLLSYFFQFWLPRPPFLNDQVSGVYPLWETMFKGFVGRFGWLDYQFAAWVYKVAALATAGLLALAVRALVVGRSALRGRSAELACYVLMVLGLMVVIAVPAYKYRLNTGYPFEQARYLFPLLALYGGLVGLAVRGAGERAGAYLAPAIVLFIGALNIYGLLLTLARYYA